MEALALQCLAVAVMGFVGSAVGFRFVIHETVCTDEITQAISAFMLCLSVFFAEQHNTLPMVPSLVKLLVLAAMFQWTRKVQIQGPHCEDKNTMDLRDKVVLITGGNSGIGLQSAKFCFQRGATVIVASRNVDLANQVFATEQLVAKDRICVMRLDLESFASVREFAQEFNAKFPKLDILLLNAGVMMVERKITEDKWESMMQTNCFSPFLLTLLLLKPLKQSSLHRARVICVSSSTAKLTKEIPLADLNAELFYNIFYTYGTSKYAMNQLFFELERKIGKQISINTLHPGAIVTDIVRNLPWWARTFRFLVRPWFKSPLEGSNTQLFVATNHALDNVSGKHFEHCQVHYCARADREQAKLFFAQAEQAVGIKFEQCWE